MPTQQQKPSRMGLPPVRTRCTMLVFRPMAAMAMMMKNLLSSLSGAVTAAGSWNRVVTTDASTKNSTKNGKIFFRLTLPAPAVFLSFRARTKASTSVMGMMARVRVSFTVTALSSVALPRP